MENNQITSLTSKFKVKQNQKGYYAKEKLRGVDYTDTPHDISYTTHPA
jgi:hypothetical protein